MAGGFHSIKLSWRIVSNRSDSPTRKKGIGTVPQLYGYQGTVVFDFVSIDGQTSTYYLLHQRLAGPHRYYQYIDTDRNGTFCLVMKNIPLIPHPGLIVCSQGK